MPRKLKGGEPTANVTCNLESFLIDAARVEKVRRKCRLRDLYHEAIEEWLERREEADKYEVPGLYWANPGLSEDVPTEQVIITVREDLMGRIKTWADRDARNYTDLMYGIMAPYLVRLART